MADPGAIEWLAVERSLLDVLVLRGSAFRLDDEGAPRSQTQRHLREEGRTDIVHGYPRGHRVDTHHGEDHEGRHTATVFVTRHTHQVATEPRVDELTHQTLRAPGSASIVVEIGDVEAGLVRHSELPDVPRLVGELAVELPLGHTEWCAQGLVQTLDEALTTAHQIDEVSGVVLYVPAVGVGIVLIVVVTCTEATRELIVEGLDEAPLLILGMEEARIVVEELAVVVGATQIVGTLHVVAGELRQLRQTPVVVGSSEADGDTLALLPQRHLGDGLLLPDIQTREVAFLIHKLREYPLGATCPGQVRLLRHRLLRCLVSSTQVEAREPLGIGISEGSDGMRAVHTVRVARDFGEGRQPSLGALLGHTKVAREHLLLLHGVEEDA